MVGFMARVMIMVRIKVRVFLPQSKTLNGREEQNVIFHYLRKYFAPFGTTGSSNLFL